MLTQITYFQILGKPLIMWLGVITLLSFLFAALIAFLDKKGINKIPFKWHSIMAKVSLLLAIIHAILGIAIYF